MLCATSPGSGKFEVVVLVELFKLVGDRWLVCSFKHVFLLGVAEDAVKSFCELGESAEIADSGTGSSERFLGCIDGKFQLAVYRSVAVVFGHVCHHFQKKADVVEASDCFGVVFFECIYDAMCADDMFEDCIAYDGDV